MRFIDRFYSRVGVNEAARRRARTHRVRAPATRMVSGSGGGRAPPGVNRTRSRMRRTGRSRMSTRRSRTRRGSRKRVSLRPSDHSKKGFYAIYEASGTTSTATSDAEAVYIGHCDMPPSQTLRLVVSAIVKAAFGRIGKFFRDPNDQIGFSGSFQFQYYLTSTANALSFSNVAFVATDTIDKVNFDSSANLEVIMQGNAGMRPYAYQLVPTGGIPRTFYCDGLTVTVSTKSRLKIQNRTPNAAASADVDTNNINYLVGNQYEGSGTGTYVKAQNLGTPHQPFIGDAIFGQMEVSEADNLNGFRIFLKHPPENAKAFTDVKKISSVSKFAPGATKYSSLSSQIKISFHRLIDNYLKQIDTATYVLSKLGKFRFFGFQKLIDDDAGVKVNIAFEVESQVGCTVKMYETTRTNPNYFEAPAS